MTGSAPPTELSVTFIKMSLLGLMLLLACFVSPSYGYTGIEMPDRPDFDDQGYYIDEKVARE